jgi:hypothetical protein
MMKLRMALPVLGALVIAAGALGFVSLAAGASATANVRVTLDNDTSYLSADQVGGTGTYTDAVLSRCGHDLRPQNEPTLAIDPRDASVWVAGANDYCTVPTAGDAWPGHYRSTNAGSSWVDSLVPGYNGDASPQASGSPLAQLAAAGAHAAGDPVVGWDTKGRLFYMGNNFSRGVPSGNSGVTHQNIGSIWVTTYAPSNATDHSTDGSQFVRTVLVATNVPGLGQSTDKTALGIDPTTDNVYAAWSDFHGGGCNEIDFARSTDHGATFSAPVKLSTGLCGNQAPSFAFGTLGQVYIAWAATTGGSKAQNGVNGAAFTVSTDQGLTFTKPRLAFTYTPFVSDQFSGNGARQCGDPPFNCPTGFTFPRFDLAAPFLTADNVNGTLVMAFQAAQPNGQGQIDYSVSPNGGTTWSTRQVLAASNGHQFFPYLTASAGRVSAIWYDSAGDPSFDPTRPPCNNATGQTSACLNVRYASSSNGGTTWSSPLQITDTPTNPNYEQFSGRAAPFFGDYITVAAVGNTIGAVWTDQRDAVAAADSTADNDGADVAGDPETGGTCTSPLDTCFDGTGGLDQNIYAASITP